MTSYPSSVKTDFAAWTAAMNWTVPAMAMEVDLGKLDLTAEIKRSTSILISTKTYKVGIFEEVTGTRQEWP